MTDATEPAPAGLSTRWQAVAWLAALGVALAGMLDVVAEFSPELATTYFVWLAVGPIGWFLVRHRSAAKPTTIALVRWTLVDTAWGIALGGLSLALSLLTAAAIGPLSPAYHDEYSYLFEAQTLLSGRVTWPSHPTHPELFETTHVLNEGVMASRYYPGNAAWMAPWLAMGHPYWGHWLAGALSAAAVYGVGRESAGRRCGAIAGLLFAAAPGPALFGNLLLAHQPTLLGLMVFLWAFVCGQRTGSWRSWLIAGCGLSFAMVCRPATAAGFALPFGVWWFATAVPAWRGSETLPPRRLVHWLALGMPLVCGWGVMIAYNHAVTGSWRTSPYQLYTDIYTPRHVFGLNNVVRGERHLGPKVLEEYDRWAENLTPSLAWKNVGDRLLATGLSTIDLPLLAMTAVLLIAVCRHGDRRWTWLVLSIVALHAVHWPYWYAGIMGWHYVFETAPLWCLACGRLTDLLWQTWRGQQRDVLPVWWCGLAVIAWSGMYVDGADDQPSRWRKSVAAIRYPRRQHAEFRHWVTESVGEAPALVLIEAGTDGPHLDFVINPPDLCGPLLFGRYRPERTDLAAVVRDFPERRVFLCRPDRHELQPVGKPNAR